MDEQINCVNGADEVMIPGFRFHPTDEKLVEFYLTMKIQNKPLAIDLIRQLHIYYNPWELPKLPPAGETEWYFYHPRGRKYRNSTRLNGVTVAKFYKALVFYKGRAPKCVKTDWMMHELRLAF